MSRIKLITSILVTLFFTALLCFSLFWPDSTDEHNEYFNLIIISTDHMANGEMENAIKTGQNAVTVAESNFGTDSFAVAICLGHMSVIYDFFGQDAEALSCVERNLAIHEKLSGTDSPDLIPYLLDLGRRYDNIGREDEANALQERVKKIKAQ